MLIAVTGGIGSGKSVVCRILTAMGYPVYDCDSRAKGLMDTSDDIKRRIACGIGEECIDREGCIVRTELARKVFADRQLLAALNNITHGAVREDLKDWQCAQTSNIAFVETAILYESGLNRMVDAVWEVVAPTELRVQRVMDRSGLTARQVKERIASQCGTVESPHSKIFTIENDGMTPMIPQINSLLAAF